MGPIERDAMSKKNPVAGKATATVTITADARAKLIAAGIDVGEMFPETKAPKKGAKGKKAKKAKMPKKVKAARVACYEARMERRSDPARKGGAGMTKPERLALAAELRAAGKDPSNARVWNAACAKARGLK